MKLPLAFIALLAVSVVYARSQDAPDLYESGHFPPGKVYQATELEALVDQPIPDPTYLVGQFVYLGEDVDAEKFINFRVDENDLTHLHFGDVAIFIHFLAGRPTLLQRGKTLSCNEDDPLTVVSVSRVTRHPSLIVKAECHSRFNPNNKVQPKE